MKNTKNTQNNFVNNIFNLEDKKIHNEIHSVKGIRPESLMEIYRNNSFSAASKAMQLTYPAIKKLVGEDFLEFAAYKYIQQNPPLSGNLDDFGGAFANFLKNFKPAESIPYLFDIAQLEWLIRSSELIDNSQQIDYNALSKIPQDKYFELTFKLQPSAFFLSSPYPIDKIWELATSDSEPDENFDITLENGANIMIIRPYDNVSIVPLTISEFTFLKSLNEGASFYESFEAAIAKDEDFDLGFYIKKHIENATFCDFESN